MQARHSVPKCHAFTLIELLVAITIIALLTALTVPAVHAQPPAAYLTSRGSRFTSWEFDVSPSE